MPRRLVVELGSWADVANSAVLMEWKNRVDARVKQLCN
jgi:hypothetical protein